MARQHRAAPRAVPERRRLPHRTRRPGRSHGLRLAAHVHRDLPRCGRARRLVRPGARARRGRRGHEALPPNRRVAVPDGAEHRARGFPARPHRGGVRMVAMDWSLARSPERGTHARFVEAVVALAEDPSAANVARYLRASTALEHGWRRTPRRTAARTAA